jgi:hypothetical protein
LIEALLSKARLRDDTVWTVDFETPVCKLYLLFICADAAQEKEKSEESAAGHWCFKVCSPYSTYNWPTRPIMPNKFEQYFCTSQTKALIFMTT